MSGWHVTWQDPVAVVVALACLGVVWWLRRLTAKSGRGCAGCAAKTGTSDRIPAQSLSIGRRHRPR